MNKATAIVLTLGVIGGLLSAGPAVSEFHVSKPSGWPKGDYKVEIFLGDATLPALTKNFKVG